MASRYSEEYFFQHCLMNIPFTDLIEIIHLRAESIPEYIRHFASALFVNDSFWNNVNAITQELQVEGNSDDYINSYLSYINMLRTTYNLVTQGKSLPFFFLLLYVNIYIYMHIYIYTYACTYIYIYIHIYIYIYIYTRDYILQTTYRDQRLTSHVTIFFQRICIG